MNEIEISNKTFENIKHIDENKTEFWYARELMVVLEYSKWGDFDKVIEKAKIACELSQNLISDHFVGVDKMIKIAKEACRNSDIIVSDHFVGVDKMVNIGSGAKRKCTNLCTFLNENVFSEQVSNMIL